MARWSRQGYHVQHNDALWAGVQIDLFCGAGQSAWNLVHQAWPALRRSLLLRVQFIRTSMHFLRARAALAAAAELESSRPAEACSLLAIATRAARSLERESMPCPRAYALMIRGGLAALGGDSRRTAILFSEAIERLRSREHAALLRCGPPPSGRTDRWRSWPGGDRPRRPMDDRSKDPKSSPHGIHDISKIELILMNPHGKSMSRGPSSVYCVQSGAAQSRASH